MNIQIRLTGTSPLLMHNPRMVDPQYALNVEIKAITTKRKKTEADFAAIEKLEWYGGLYDEDGIIVQPTSKARKCIINTGRISKIGKSLERSLAMSSLNVPLEYDGPKDIDAVFAKGQFHSRLSVGISGKRVMRVRPKFFPWALTINGVFIEDAGLNWDELERVVELAGIVEGIGDNRVNGYGRFVGKVVKL